MGIEEQIREMLKEEAKTEGMAEGLREGELKVQRKLAQKLIFKMGYTDRQAAKLLEVPVKFIAGIRRNQHESIISNFAQV